MITSSQATSDLQLLDSPIWSALNTRLASFSLNCGTAKMMAQDVSPMAASAGLGPTQMKDFEQLVLTRGSPVVTLERDVLPRSSKHLKRETRGCVQLVASAPSKPKDTYEIEALDARDAKEIFALADLTKPGPFAQKTYTMGDFIGIKQNGKLIAMAGQRLKVPGYTEISAVCVAPEFQGKGIGAELVRQMSARVIRSGDVPFLHAYESNPGAIGLYESLGFEIRAKLHATVWSIENPEQL